MKLTLRTCDKQDDLWRVPNFLREVFLLNDRLEHSWHVARLDYWLWHYILTCNICKSVEAGMALWETPDGKIVAALNHLGGSELRLHMHPQFYSADLEHEMLTYAEKNYFATTEDGRRYIHLPIFEDDTRRQELVQSRGYKKQPGWGHHYRRDLTAPHSARREVPPEGLGRAQRRDANPARITHALDNPSRGPRPARQSRRRTKTEPAGTEALRPGRHAKART